MVSGVLGRAKRFHEFFIFGQEKGSANAGDRKRSPSAGSPHRTTNDETPWEGGPSLFVDGCLPLPMKDSKLISYHFNPQHYKIYHFHTSQDRNPESDKNFHFPAFNATFVQYKSGKKVQFNKTEQPPLPRDQPKARSPQSAPPPAAGTSRRQGPSARLPQPGPAEGEVPERRVSKSNHPAPGK